MAFELKAKKEALQRAGKRFEEISGVVQKEQRSFTAEEKTEVAALRDDITSLKADIETLQMLDMDVPTFETRSEPTTELRSGKRPATDKDYDMVLRAHIASKAKWNFAKCGLNVEEVRSAANRIGLEDFNGAGMEFRAQNVGTPSAGGFTVQPSLISSLVEKRKYAGGMLAAAYNFNTENGSTTISHPILDDTSNKATRASEGATHTNTSLTLGSVDIDTEVYNSAVFPITAVLLRDSEVNIQQMVVNALGRRMFRRINADATNHADFIGLLQGATSVSVSGGYFGTVSYDTFVEMKHQIDPDYRGSGSYGWMFNDDMLMELSLLQDEFGRPLWAPSMTAGVPDKILSYPFWINPDFGAGIVAHGDFSAYHLREVGSPEVIVLNELYQVSNSSVGVLIRQSWGGNLVDTSAIKQFPLNVS